jgi:hypothetical protein
VSRCYPFTLSVATLLEFVMQGMRRVEKPSPEISSSGLTAVLAVIMAATSEIDKNVAFTVRSQTSADRAGHSISALVSLCLRNAILTHDLPERRDIFACPEPKETRCVVHHPRPRCYLCTAHARSTRGKMTCACPLAAAARRDVLGDCFKNVLTDSL